MNRKFVILFLLILSIISVCPLPFDNGTFLVGILNNQAQFNQLDYLFRLIGMTSGFYIVFYVIILVGMILYFKSYSFSSDCICNSFIVLYVLLLITQVKGLEFLMKFSSANYITKHVVSMQTMTTILLIITLILMTALTILFIKLVKDSYAIDYQIPVIIFTILVYITQSILFIGTHVYTIKIANINITGRNTYPYTSTPIQSLLYQNFQNFSDVMSIISFLLITIMKIFFILVVIKEIIYTDEEHSPILNKNAS